MLKSEYNNNQYREKKDPGEGEHERGNIEGKRNGNKEKRKPEELEEVEQVVTGSIAEIGSGPIVWG